MILVMYFKTDGTKKLLPRHIIIQIAQQELDLMIRVGQFPFDSKVYVSPSCQTKYENDLITDSSGPVSYAVGFYELVHGSQFKRDFVMFLNPYDGNVTGINEMRLGYDGTQTRDVMKIPVGVIQGSFKTNEFGKPGM